MLMDNRDNFLVGEGDWLKGPQTFVGTPTLQGLKGVVTPVIT